MKVNEEVEVQLGDGLKEVWKGIKPREDAFHLKCEIGWKEDWR